ncbi:MAG: hypothetical protein AABX23_02480 [Nanoarchaeota archaeon]
MSRPNFVERDGDSFVFCDRDGNVNIREGNILNLVGRLKDFIAQGLVDKYNVYVADTSLTPGALGKGDYSKFVHTFYNK